MTDRPSAERLAELRAAVFSDHAALSWSVNVVRDVFRELDAVTRERDEARKVTDEMIERAVQAFNEARRNYTGVNANMEPMLTVALRAALTAALDGAA